MTRDDRVIGIIQPFVPNYRLGLFDALAARLESEGLELEVWHAQPKGRVAARGNAATGPWSVPIRQHRLSIGRRNITVRNVHARSRRVRAVIAGLASTNLETYGLAADPSVRLMLWGHGRNYTAGNNGLDQTMETWLRRRSAHVFTYTESGKEHLVAAGTDPEKVTVVQNSTDTRALRRAVSELPASAAWDLRDEHNLGTGPVCLYIGAFDEPKKLPLLFEAADLIHAALPGFRLVLAGAGPDEPEVRRSVDKRPYSRLMGRVNADGLARLSTVASAVLIPGRVGLVAVDALALGLPIITTNYALHAPEADYLTAGIDSVWTDMSAEAYAGGVLDALRRPERLNSLALAALHRGREFSVEDSARRFADGIIRGLQ